MDIRNFEKMLRERPQRVEPEPEPQHIQEEVPELTPEPSQQEPEPPQEPIKRRRRYRTKRYKDMRKKSKPISIRLDQNNVIFLRGHNRSKVINDLISRLRYHKMMGEIEDEEENGWWKSYLMGGRR